MPYQSLDAQRITDTVERLHRRIEERFGDSGLGRVCNELVGLSRKARDQTDTLTRPILGLRIASALLVALIVGGLGVMVYTIGASSGTEGLTLVEFIQLLEAGINDVVLIGLAVYFLVSLERRIKRRRVLAAIHELRSIAHIVDMHQLTKDPAHTLRTLEDTPSSPVRTMDRAGLERYLDYSSEMLSLIGKIAALYVQKWDDDVVLAAVNEVEGLTSGLSAKIWQKVMILETYVREQSARGSATD